MRTSRTIELEQGTTTRRLHPHNGYYAGDFGARRPMSSASLSELSAQLTALPRRPSVEDPS